MKTILFAFVGITPLLWAPSCSSDSTLAYDADPTPVDSVAGDTLLTIQDPASLHQVYQRRNVVYLDSLGTELSEQESLEYQVVGGDVLYGTPYLMYFDSTTVYYSPKFTHYRASDPNQVYYEDYNSRTGNRFWISSNYSIHKYSHNFKTTNRDFGALSVVNFIYSYALDTIASDTMVLTLRCPDPNVHYIRMSYSDAGTPGAEDLTFGSNVLCWAYIESLINSESK